MNEDGSLTITLADLLGTASDVDGDTLSITGLSLASGQGTLTDNGDGTWTFTPTADWNGSVAFTYTVDTTRVQWEKFPKRRISTCRLHSEQASI